MKNYRKIICAILILAMLVPMMSFGTSAADIVNLYDNAKATVGTPPSTKDAAGSGNANYYVSNPIEVKEGDVVTFGPCQKNQGYFLTTYDANGNQKISQVKYADCKDIGTIIGDTVICQWTVPAGSAYVRMATAQLYFDCTMITVNQAWTKDDYFATMDKAGINVDFLRPTESKDLVNVFPTSNKTFAGRSAYNDGDVEAAAYRTSDYIPVKPGDVLYFAAAVLSQGYHLTLYDANKKGTTNVKIDYSVLYEDIGRGYGILAYRMRPGTAYVRIVAATGVYDDGIQFATLNQPFSGETYRKMYNITIDDTPTKAGSPLNGLKGLFMGDSITFGSGDQLSYNRIGRAWAGRIQTITGLQSTNAAVGGAKVSYQRGDDNWVYSQYEPYVNEKFDIIVMHGGVNDARYDRPVGTLSEGKDEATLKKNQTSYVGGLEWIFYKVSTTNTEAKLFFIANHRLDGHSKGSAKDMSAYFDAAREACKKWGVIFIDLYNNKELNDKLETTTTKYLPDTLHLNGAGYDIVTPYIIEVLEGGVTGTITPETDAPETTAAPETTEAPVETTEAPEVPEATTNVDVTEAPEITEAPAVEKSGCGSMIAGAVAVIALLGTAIVFKKKD